MAADSIKHIAAFSSDGITQALHRLFPDKDKQDVFTAKLTELAGLLENPAKIAKMDSRNVIPSAKTVFENLRQNPSPLFAPTLCTWNAPGVD